MIIYPVTIIIIFFFIFILIYFVFHDIVFYLGILLDSSYYGGQSISVIYTTAKILEVFLPAVFLTIWMRPVDRWSVFALIICFFYLLGFLFGFNPVMIGRAFAVTKFLILPILFRNLFYILKRDQFFLIAMPVLSCLYIFILYGHIWD